MDQNESRLTVLFQPPFWVGIAERWTAEGYEAARAVFGAEPTDAALFQWVLGQWGHLQFSPAEPGEGPRQRPVNARRARREARAALAGAGMGTKAQQALNRLQEQESAQSQQRRKQRRQEREERCYLLRQQKKREKKRGR